MRAGLDKSSAYSQLPLKFPHPTECFPEGSNYQTTYQITRNSPEIAMNDLRSEIGEHDQDIDLEHFTEEDQRNLAAGYGSDDEQYPNEVWSPEGGHGGLVLDGVPIDFELHGFHEAMNDEAMMAQLDNLPEEEIQAHVARFFPQGGQDGDDYEYAESDVDDAEPSADINDPFLGSSVLSLATSCSLLPVNDRYDQSAVGHKFRESLDNSRAGQSDNLVVYTDFQSPNVVRDHLTDEINTAILAALSAGEGTEGTMITVDEQQRKTLRSAVGGVVSEISVGRAGGVTALMVAHGIQGYLALEKTVESAKSAGFVRA